MLPDKIVTLFTIVVHFFRAQSYLIYSATFFDCFPYNVFFLQNIHLKEYKQMKNCHKEIALISPALKLRCLWILKQRHLNYFLSSFKELS